MFLQARCPSCCPTNQRTEGKPAEEKELTQVFRELVELGLGDELNGELADGCGGGANGQRHHHTGVVFVDTNHLPPTMHCTYSPPVQSQKFIMAI